jgi:uncharacterized protein YndB with AHSA1/START domain
MKLHKKTLFSLLILVAAGVCPAQSSGAAAAPGAAQNPVMTPGSGKKPVAASGAGKRLVIELDVAATRDEVWKAFTTSEGLETWLAPKAKVDLWPGGDWIVSFPRDTSTGGGTVVSFIPEKEIVLSALAPDRFPHVRAERTRAVFTFESHGGSTVVRLTQTGWKSGQEWDRAYEYLLAGNAELLSALCRRFADGPIDWTKLAASPAH